MPAIRRLKDAPYRWDIIAVPLSEVANQEKRLPADFISADGFGITATARRYLAPLIVGEAYPPFKNGLPSYVKLQNLAVPKKNEQGVCRLNTMISRYAAAEYRAVRAQAFVIWAKVTGAEAAEGRTPMSDASLSLPAST